MQNMVLKPPISIDVFFWKKTSNLKPKTLLPIDTEVHFPLSV